MSAGTGKVGGVPAQTRTRTRTAAPPRPLLEHRLIYVSGKGGVGKSTVAAALGVASARRGRRTVVAEVHRREDVAHVVRAAGADHISIDPQEALEDYVIDQLPVRALADLLISSRSFTYLAAATPGLRELVTAGALWELAQDRRRAADAQPYEIVVADAPATGHGVALLSAARTFGAATRVGPIARHSAIIDEMLSDPERTAVIAVTTPEEMPVNETLALRDALREQIGLDVALVVANAVRQVVLDDDERERLRAAGAHPAIAAALSADAKAHAHADQLERLRAELRDGPPVVEVPFRAGGADVRDVAAALEGAL
jgi:anion-transporting  ArsA/GET3 family ATPase